MKSFTFVVLVIAVVVIAGTIISESGVDMRTPITQPGFDNWPTLIDMEGTIHQEVNTNAEEEIYRVTIPRNSLGLVDRVVRVELDYTAIQNTGGPATITWRAYYGTSAAVVTPADTWANNVNFRYGRLNVWLINTGAINTQALRMRDENNAFIGATGALTQNSNEELDLVITSQFSVAHLSFSIWRLVAQTIQMSP